MAEDKQGNGSSFEGLKDIPKSKRPCLPDNLTAAILKLVRETNADNGSRNDQPIPTASFLQVQKPTADTLIDAAPLFCTPIASHYCEQYMSI